MASAREPKPNPKFDTAWMTIARERFDELHLGSVKAVPGDEVFARLEKRGASKQKGETLHN